MKSGLVSPSRWMTWAMPSITAALVPGRGTQVQHAVVGELDPARVDRHELHPAQRRLLDARADDRVALGRVGADQDRRAGVVEVEEGARRAGQTEGLAQGEARRRVADAAAVVDVVGADRGAHQALHRVAVLVGGAARRQAGDRVRPVVGLDPRQLGLDAVQRLLPRRDPEVAVLPDQRRGQAVAAAAELVREAALEAGVALVGGPVGRGRDARHLAVARMGLEAATDAAVAAGGRDA